LSRLSNLGWRRTASRPDVRRAITRSKPQDVPYFAPLEEYLDRRGVWLARCAFVLTADNDASLRVLDDTMSAAWRFYDWVSAAETGQPLPAARLPTLIGRLRDMRAVGGLGGGDAGGEPQGPEVRPRRIGVEERERGQAERVCELDQDVGSGLGSAALPPGHALAARDPDQTGELMRGEASPLAGSAQCSGVEGGHGHEP